MTTHLYVACCSQNATMVSNHALDIINYANRIDPNQTPSAFWEL